MKIDKYGQFKGKWSEFDYDILEILEEVDTPTVNPDRSLHAYLTDIKKRIRREL